MDFSSGSSDDIQFSEHSSDDSSDESSGSNSGNNCGYLEISWETLKKKSVQSKSNSKIQEHNNTQIQQKCDISQFTDDKNASLSLENTFSEVKQVKQLNSPNSQNNKSEQSKTNSRIQVHSDILIQQKCDIYQFTDDDDKNTPLALELISKAEQVKQLNSPNTSTSICSPSEKSGSELDFLSGLRTV